MPHDDIRIGALAGQGAKTPQYLQQILPHGFESFQINFWQKLPEDVSLAELARQVRDVLDAAPDLPDGGRPIISSLGMFGNPLQDASQVEAWCRCIDACRDFGCDIVAGFAGAIEGRLVPESMASFKKVFAPLAKRAADRGVRLAFENCDMGGNWSSPKWNIAHAPEAWEMMFNEVPDDNVGLEWEPCHQMASLIDPLPQLREWLRRGKVFHLHGKDASVDWAGIRRLGIRSPRQHVFHRTPGFGDTNWTDVISILRQHKFRGAIDIEGWHDPVYRDELEMTGQVHGLRHLQQCRGGAFVPNPTI